MPTNKCEQAKLLYLHLIVCPIFFAHSRNFGQAIRQIYNGSNYNHLLATSVSDLTCPRAEPRPPTLKAEA